MAAGQAAPPAYAFVADCTKQVSFIRHGEAVHNVAARDVGAEASFADPRLTDSPLTETGLAQAADLRQTLLQSGVKFDLVIVSPLLRTLQTAATLFGEQDGQPSLSALHTASGTSVPLPMLAVEVVREAFGVHFSSKRGPVSAVQGDFPEVDFSLIKTDADTWHDEERRETLREVAERGTQFVKFLRALPQKNIAVVSHGVFLETLLYHVLSSGDERVAAKRFMNCECRTLTVAFPPTTEEVQSSPKLPFPHSVPLPNTYIAHPAGQTTDASGAPLQPAGDEEVQRESEKGSQQG